jgi:hypothetical protein
LHLKTGSRSAGSIHEDVFHGISQTQNRRGHCSPNPLLSIICRGIQKYAEKYGFEVVFYETYPAAMEDITPILQKIKAKNPDILCVGSHAIVAMMVMKQSKEIDSNPKAYYRSWPR